MKQLKIGSLKLKNPLFLAPMVDVSDLAYRLICRKAGAAMAYTEMIHVESIIHKNKTIEKKMITEKKDSPIGIQITGKNIGDFKKVLEDLRNYDLVDLNCGCPGHLTVDHGSGSYLLNSPEKIGKIISLLKNEGLRVSAKIRLGFKKENVLKIAKAIEKAGADALTLHPRLASQGRGIQADWSYFEKVKKKIGIPLIGNGDVFRPVAAKKILETCEAVMIARGAIGNPLIFDETLYYLKKEKDKKFDYKKNMKLYLEYLKLAKKYDLLKMGKVKYLGGKFLRGFEGAPEARDEFMKLKSYEKIEEFFRFHLRAINKS